MHRLLNIVSVYAAVALVLVGSATPADAQQRNERQIRDIVRSLNSRVDDFQYSLDGELRGGSVSRQDADDLRRSVRNLQDKVNAFDDNLAQRRENRDDVASIVAAARDVDVFFRRGSRVSGTMETDWNGVRGLVDRLASNYGVTPDWSGRISNVPAARTYPPISTSRNYPSRTSTVSTAGTLTGTYQLDASRSESTDQILTDANVSGANRQDLETKLEAPEQIAISVRGSQVTLASSKASPVTFLADGRERSESANGKTVRLRATMRGDELVVSSIGGESDYTITFTPADGGRSLKVTRRVTTDYLAETILTDSFYTRSDVVARLGIDTSLPADTSSDSGTYSSNDPADMGRNSGGAPAINYGRTGEYLVPNGTVLTGMLDNTIDTKISQNNDRFKMVVQSPDEFRGAIVEGHLSGVGRSGQVSGSSNVTFNFDRITLRDGRTFDFAATLQSIKDQNGKVVKVDTEGTAKGQSQTKETVKRGGLGAGLGALIGAIAGGGQGAAIGAIIGGGVGAGSVVVQGRDDVRLMKGSTITVVASSPIRRDTSDSEN